VRILRHQQAQILFRGECARGDVEHRVLAPDQVLPEELAPRFAHGRIDAHTLLRVHMAEHLVAAADDLMREAREEWADVATAVGHDPDFNLAGMAGERLSQFCRFRVRVS